MYRRLTDKSMKPSEEEAITFIGLGKEMFENIDNFLVHELNAKKEIEFSTHDKCWGMDYRVNGRPICGIYFEKDAVFIVAMFSMAKENKKGYENMYNSLSPYARMCVDSSPWRRNGFVEYRVLSVEQLDDLIIMLKCRVNEKYRSKAIK